MAVPTELGDPRNIEERRAAQRKWLLSFADRARLPVAPGQARIVTGCAGADVAAGQDGVEEQHSPELRLRVRIWIAFWKRYFRRAAIVFLPLGAARLFGRENRRRHNTAIARPRRPALPPDALFAAEGKFPWQQN